MALVLALLASALALQAGTLTVTGATASTLLGTIVLGLGGWQWALLLLAFFVTSSTLSRAFKPRKLAYAADYAKGEKRDAAQVAANGSVAAVFVLLHYLSGQATWTWIGFAAALAAANADTWATEVGVLGDSRPRLITHLAQAVEPGTSGGVSIAGTLSALGGSLLIALSASILQPSTNWFAVPIITLAGLAGSLVDSILGATIQAIYFCPADQRETEKHPLHGCGAQTSLIRGWRWFNNDWVNWTCTATGALIACGLAASLGGL